MDDGDGPAPRAGDNALLDARFRQVFGHALVGIAIVAADGRLHHCNPALERMLGYAEAELCGRPFAALAHEGAPLAEPFEAVRTGQRDHAQTETRLAAKDGRALHVRVSLSRMGDVPGAEGEVLAMVEDVGAHWTLRSEHLRAVHDLGERVKEATAIHQVAGMLCDGEADLRDLLRHVADLLPPAFQYPEVTVARVRYGATSAETAGWRDVPWRLAAPLRTRDGTAGAVEVRYTAPRPTEAEGPFLAEERALVDSIAELLCAILDRRLAEEALERSSEQLRLAQSAAGMATWEWDAASDAVRWSDDLVPIVEPPAAPPGTLAELLASVHPEDRHAVEAAMRAAVEDADGDGRYEAEFRVVLPDRSVRVLASRGRVVPRPGGAPGRLVGMAHDVTALREMEHRLHAAEKLDALGRLAGGIAHDFNNLLTAIRGYAAFLRDDLPPGDRRREDVEEIAAAADRAAALTQQLLAFSRRQVMTPRVVDPNAVIGGIERMLRRVIGSDLTLEVALGPGVGAVRIDPGKLEQVVVNLALNARDAMPNGGVLTIETDEVNLAEREAWAGLGLHAGPHVVLRVRDTGTGMTAETRDRLFEPFFTTKEHGRGTGLGLATVYGIVQQSAGAIRVDSEPGHGSTFEVFLPRVDGDAEPEAEAAPAPVSFGGTECVLVVDDDAGVRTLAERALRKQGYQVLTASDGMDALTLLEAHPDRVDLVVTDVVMPRLKGPALAARVRASHPEVRLMYVTGYTERRIPEEDLDAGIRVLPKPFTPAELLRTVRAALDAPPHPAPRDPDP